MIKRVRANIMFELSGNLCFLDAADWRHRACIPCCGRRSPFRFEGFGCGELDSPIARVGNPPCVTALHGDARRWCSACAGSGCSSMYAFASPQSLPCDGAWSWVDEMSAGDRQRPALPVRRVLWAQRAQFAWRSACAAFVQHAQQVQRANGASCKRHAYCARNAARAKRAAHCACASGTTRGDAGRHCTCVARRPSWARDVRGRRSATFSQRRPTRR